AFCAVDHRPRRWTGEQLGILKELTAVAITILDQRRASVGAGMRDLVTGLPRQPLFTEQLHELLTSSIETERVAVVAINLADFKLLNDALGHEAGDQALAEVGLRLEQLANAHRRKGRVTRIVADTFLVAVAVSRTEPRGQFEHDVLRAIIDRPVTLDGQDHPLGARVATVTAQPDTTASTLIATACAAIEDARLLDASEGAGTLAIQGPARERLMIRNRLHGAHGRDELSLEYQPSYDLATGAITGLEALVRWDHPELGPVPPNVFVPVAESSGAIVPIGEWVVGRALADLAVWRERYPALELGVSVNVAPEQLLVRTFTDRVVGALRVNGVPPSALTLEITERTLGSDQPAMQATLTALREHGVLLSLDDFGTGYSSLRRLTASPLDELKLDRPLISNLATDGRRQAVIAGITAMSRALGMRVVAEGVETAEQREILVRLGCGHAQGFLLARPAPAGDIDGLLRVAAARTRPRVAVGPGRSAGS
ncbi:MAG: GGDEF domain-containing phosphodiesterase, partial [Solirubrobacteraceae bacterium]|nr:GGDEF domain-containing phosphodiesterase [Solirubrobacteraceae bacterium]